MHSKTKKRTIKDPEVIYRDKKPVSVIIDIDEYNKLLDRLEDIDDIKYIKELKKKSLSFRKLDDILAEQSRDV